MKTSWKDEVINAFKRIGKTAHLSELYKNIELNTSRKLSDSYKAIIRATLERNSSDSEAFNGKDDLFYIVNIKGQGYWGIR